MSTHRQASFKNDLLLSLGAIGVVFGDIGTSPLYAIKSCFFLGNVPVLPLHVLGIISLILWLLFLIVTLKYVILVMRVDDQGEGGVLVISNLVSQLKLKGYTKLILFLGIVGGGLFMGDCVITPAISILSALEGVYVIAPFLTKYIVLMSCLVIILLFWFQSKGTESLGRYFGPILFLWFIVLGVLGVSQILHAPDILYALNPYHAFSFLYNHGTASLYVLGGAILALTGAEALYADMGHFGKRPIRFSWSFVVFPALLLNYLGQGALLLHNPAAIVNPFYHMAPEIAQYPLIFLATIATIIASQAVISGVFSVAWQAIMLGYIPRLKVMHTSHTLRGEVYVPALNIILALLTLLAVILFQTSENLAAAYGLSVAGVMLLTSLFASLIARETWGWSVLKVTCVFGGFIILDLFFVVTNIFKFLDGAWYALIIAAAIIYICQVWQRGNRALDLQKYHPHATLQNFMEEQYKIYETRIPATAIYLSRNPEKVPNALMIQLQHNKFLHEKMIFVCILVTPRPVERGKNKITVKFLEHQCFVISASYGYKESPDLKKIMDFAEAQNILIPGEECSYFLSRGVAIASPRKALTGVGEKIYIYLSKNALTAYEFYKIPHDKVVELGVRYKI